MKPLPAKTYNFVYDGNSRVMSARTTAAQAFGAVLQGMQNQSRFSYLNDGVSGLDTQNMIATYATRENSQGPYISHPGYPGIFQAAPVVNILFCWEIVNDLNTNSLTDAQALANWATYVALARATGYTVWTFTILGLYPFTAQQNQYIANINVALRANAGKIYGDWVGDLVSAFPQFQTFADTTYYDADQLHFNALSNQMIARFLFNRCLAAHIC